LLAPLLTDGNCESLLARASHRSKREMEELVAELSPRPDVAAAIRKLPDTPRTPAEPVELSPGRVATRAIDPFSSAIPSQGLEPLSRARYKVQFAEGVELRDKLERLTELMRAEVPSGDIAQPIEQAVTEKLARLEAKRFASPTAPRQKLQATHTTPTSRHIPAAVRRAVYEG